MKIVLGILAVLLFLFWRFIKAKGRPVLEVTVDSSDGFTYSVKTKKLIEQMYPIEHVRHYINYLTKFLYILSNQQDYERKAILQFISEVAQLEEINENNVLELMDVNMDNKIVGDKSFKSILYFQNTMNRMLDFKFPTSHYRNQFIGSVQALLLHNCQILDRDHLVYLLESIRYLDKAYRTGTNPRDINSMGNLPNIAFLDRERII